MKILKEKLVWLATTTKPTVGGLFKSVSQSIKRKTYFL